LRERKEISKSKAHPPSLGHSVCKCFSLASTAGRVGFPYAAQCGGYFICISLHTSTPVVPFFLPSPLVSPRLPHRSFFPFLASRFLSASRSLVLLSPYLSSLPPVVYMYLFYFIIKQTSSCHPRATCVFTRIYEIHVKHSLHLTRGSAYATVPDTKNIFSLYPPLVPSIIPPSRFSSVI